MYQKYLLGICITESINEKTVDMNAVPAPIREIGMIRNEGIAKQIMR